MILNITEYKSRDSVFGTPREYTWDSFKSKLKTPVYTQETVAEYKAMKAADDKESIDAIKDIGGYVGGELSNNRRKMSNVMSRCLLVIDADSACMDDVENFQFMYDDVVFFAHTTHTSTPEALRLRWLFPLSRKVSSNEYRYLVSVVKHWVGAASIDESTDEPQRLMYWPSLSSDAEYQYWEGGDKLLDPDELLDGVDVDSISFSRRSTLVPEEDGGKILTGGRNKGVFNFAYSLRQGGVEGGLLHEMVAMFNENVCEPPLADFEVKAICRSVKNYSKGELLPFNIRGANDDFFDLGAEDESSKKKKKGLVSINASDLDKKIIPELTYIVPDLIPAGLTIIASPPKFGKSWFCLDLCLSVSTGTPILGMPTNQCDTLYLALEDSEKRLQNRIRKIADGRVPPEGAHFVIEAPALAEGLLDSIRNFISEFPRTKLVIIDTVQKVRGMAGKTEGVYGYDYREIGEIQKFALAMDIAVILVHHTNKAGDPDDFVNSLNGSMGVSGAADQMMVFEREKRRDKKTILHITGRDIMGSDYVVMHNAVTCRWEKIGEVSEVEESEEEVAYRTSPIVETIKYHIQEQLELCDDAVVTYSVLASDLMQEIFKRHGDKDPGINTAIGLGRAIMKMSYLLGKIDGIDVEVTKRHNANVYEFTKQR